MLIPNTPHKFFEKNAYLNITLNSDNRVIINSNIDLEYLENVKDIDKTVYKKLSIMKPDLIRKFNINQLGGLENQKVLNEKEYLFYEKELNNQIMSLDCIGSVEEVKEVEKNNLIEKILNNKINEKNYSLNFTNETPEEDTNRFYFIKNKDLILENKEEFTQFIDSTRKEDREKILTWILQELAIYKVYPIYKNINENYIEQSFSNLDIIEEKDMVDLDFIYIEFEEYYKIKIKNE